MAERRAEEGRRAARWLAPAGLFALAVAIRALPFRTVFVDGEVFLFDHDAYYHLRRIVWNVVHFPRALGFDPYVAFPDGARAIWTPCFDWLVALVALPFARADDPASVERVAVWVPPLLGGACVVSLVALARRHFDEATALLAGLLLAVLSAHFWYTQLGFVDHHAAEVLVATWLLGALMDLLAREVRAEALRGAVARTGLGLAAALLVWPGSLLYVALAEAALGVALLSRGDAVRATAFARAFAGVQAVALGALLPFAAVAGETRFGPWSPLVLSRFQPWLFATLLAVGAACAGLWPRGALGRTPAARAAVALAALAGSLALSAAALPELARGAADAWAWLGRGESFQASVSESMPILVEEHGLGVGVAVARLSWFALAAPLALAVFAAQARRRPARPARLAFAGWAAALLGVTLLQRRFFHAFAVALALLFAWTLRALDRRAAAALAGRPGARRLARAALAAAALVALAPVAETYRLHAEALLEARSDGPVHVAPGLVRRRAMLEMARWLARRTPPTAGWLEPGREPEYGVLGPWELGHIVQYVARRPAVVDNFGDDVGERGFESARRYYASAEPAASQLLDALRVRYVIAQREPPFPGPPPDERSVFAALYYLDGSEREAGAGAALPALTRHRLVYESPVRLAAAPDAPALYKVFEHVAGARVEGAAAPFARVDAEVALRTNRGRELVWRTHARADAAGRYALRLPYANRGAPPSVRVAPETKLACGGEVAALVVDEAAVRSGAALEGPSLCLRPSEAPPPAALR